MKSAGSSPMTVLAPSESKAMVDGFLTLLFTQLTEDARRTSPHYETLWQAIQKLYKAGGKRLRSYMTLLTYEAFSHTSAETILPAAAAQELLHIAMLIHDDLIDRDDIRYGIKNVARQYLDYYEELIGDTGDRQHYANSAAILAGDALIAEAYGLITEVNVDPTVVLTTQRLITKALFRVIGGELLDTEAVFRGNDSADPLLIAEEKTASSSFVGPFLMGATLAEADTQQQDILQRLGEQLGIGYQLRDDLLGVFGDEVKTGKSVVSDLKEGKRTFLVKEFTTRASNEQLAEFSKLFGRHDITELDIEKLKVLFIESGAKEAVEVHIAAYHDYCHTLLHSLDIDTAHHRAFGTLIDLCLKREK